MKSAIRPLSFAIAFAALAANAGHVAETLSLSNGWNAVYLESTPETPAPADFFADLPQVERIGCYESSVFGSTEQIASDGTTIAQKPAAYLVWERGREDASTLQRMLGGRCYLIYCTAPAEKTFYGVPGQPRTSWQDASAGFATMAGVSIPAGETVSAGAYFREGPVAAASLKSPGAAGGTDPAAPAFVRLTSFRGTPSLSAGRAYALEGTGPADWPGVLQVSVPSFSGAIAFRPGTSAQSISVANAGTTNRTVRVSYGAGEKPGEVAPPLQVYLPRNGTNEVGWTAFGTHDLELAPGESRTLALAVDKSSFAPGATNAGLVTVSDLSGGTKMRVRVSVTAEADEDSPHAAAFPKGLWYGNVTLVQVDRLSDGNPIPAGGEMRASMMVLVDADGAAHLMQRVAVATEDEPDENGARATRLWPETAAVPSGWSSRRISTVFPDIAHRSVAATAPGSFGNLLQFDWTVAADAADNPFRHAWHPDHGTGFDVTNRLALSWWSESNESTWEFSPDEVTYGIATWTLGGLSGTGDVKMRGTFALKRILDVSKIEE